MLISGAEFKVRPGAEPVNHGGLAGRESHQREVTATGSPGFRCRILGQPWVPGVRVGGSHKHRAQGAGRNSSPGQEPEPWRQD